MNTADNNSTPMDPAAVQHALYLQDVEILGESKNVNRIKKLFEHSTVKFKVVHHERKPSIQETFHFEGEESTSNTHRTESLDDLGSSFGTLSPARVHNVYGSSDDASSGLGMFPLFYLYCFNTYQIIDTDEDTRSTTSDNGSRGSSSPPTVSPEVRNRRNMILVQSRIKNLKEKVGTYYFNLFSVMCCNIFI